MKKKQRGGTEESLKLLVKTSVIVFIGVALSKILAYAYRIIIARYYGAETYGLFSLALMVIGLVGTVATLGLTQGVLRYAPLYRAKKKAQAIKYLHRFSVSILLFTSIISGGLLYLFSEYISITFFHNPTLIIYLKIFSFLIPISAISNLYLSFLRAYEQISWYSFIFNVAQNVAKVLVLVILVLIGVGGIATVYSQFIATTVVLIIAYVACRYSLSEIFGKYSLKNKKAVITEVFSYSYPIILVSIISTMFYWVDSFTLGYFLDAKAVGIYNAAVPIALLFYFVPELFMQLFLPLITREYGKKNLPLIKELSKQVGKWIFVVNLPLFILIMAFPGAIINIFFGSEYLVAQNALRFLALGSFISSIFTISQNTLSMAGKSKAILIATIFTSIINLSLNILLIPKYGLTGAAIATAVSFIILSLIFFIQSYHYLSVAPFRKKMVNITLSALISLAFLLLVKSLISITIFSMIILSLMFLLIYIGLLFITRSLDKYDKNIILIFKNRLKGLSRIKLIYPASE
ncbi:MAG: flippase [Nanoarchaeota archaeon]|nr:flippase [Nanoarchaeota archaeon]